MGFWPHLFYLWHCLLEAIRAELDAHGHGADCLDIQCCKKDYRHSPTWQSVFLEFTTATWYVRERKSLTRDLSTMTFSNLKTPQCQIKSKAEAAARCLQGMNGLYSHALCTESLGRYVEVKGRKSTCFHKRSRSTSGNTIHVLDFFTWLVTLWVLWILDLGWSRWRSNGLGSDHGKCPGLWTMLLVW